MCLVGFDAQYNRHLRQQADAHIQHRPSASAADMGFRHPAANQLRAVPEEEQGPTALPEAESRFRPPGSPRALRRSASSQGPRVTKKGNSFSSAGAGSKLHPHGWARQSVHGAESGRRAFARHSSIMLRPLERQASMLQGKRLSARALLGAFGTTGLSAVMFDLQGKVDADQLQAAQVFPGQIKFCFLSPRYKSFFLPLPG